MEFSKSPAVETTAIAGLVFIDLSVHGDARGWFKENWHHLRAESLGLKDFCPVQNNISFNATAGVTRGLHAEPWDKYISLASGTGFGAWCDLREGSATFGQVVTRELHPDIAVFVPRGVANSFQALTQSVYTYLVNAHWSPDAEYVQVNPADPALGIEWPIPLDEAILSEKDQKNPFLAQVSPVPALKTLVLGSGQLAQALRAYLDADFLGRAEFDLCNIPEDFPWEHYDTVINAAAYTAVDAAETDQERAWAVNAQAVAQLAAIAREHQLTLVHISSDYVFDGSRRIHREDEPFAPLNVYGASKAAGDLAVSACPRHYILRTSWVVGDGNNFVRTMARLAQEGVSPAVVDDQLGRLSFADEIARAIAHLLEHQAPFGTYNCTNAGRPASWFDIAQMVFASVGSQADVRPISSAEYAAKAARPAHSTLDLSKLSATGFQPRDWEEHLAAYLRSI